MLETINIINVKAMEINSSYAERTILIDADVPTTKGTLSAAVFFDKDGEEAKPEKPITIDHKGRTYNNSANAAYKAAGHHSLLASLIQLEATNVAKDYIGKKVKCWWRPSKEGGRLLTTRFWWVAYVGPSDEGGYYWKLAGGGEGKCSSIEEGITICESKIMDEYVITATRYDKIK